MDPSGLLGREAPLTDRQLNRFPDPAEHIHQRIDTELRRFQAHNVGHPAGARLSKSRLVPPVKTRSSAVSFPFCPDDVHETGFPLPDSLDLTPDLAGHRAQKSLEHTISGWPVGGNIL